MDDQGQPDTRTPHVFRHDGKDYVSMDEYLRLNQRYRDFYAPQWIPVTERLPDDGQSVIVFWSKYREVGEAVFGKDDGWFSTDRGGCYEVTHWMPLPEPPEVK
jgi:hypothetical protein